MLLMPCGTSLFSFSLWSYVQLPLAKCKPFIPAWDRAQGAQSKVRYKGNTGMQMGLRLLKLMLISERSYRTFDKMLVASSKCPEISVKGPSLSWDTKTLSPRTFSPVDASSRLPPSHASVVLVGLISSQTILFIIYYYLFYQVTAVFDD